MTIDEFIEGFAEEPGYLDFARVGPVGRAVEAEGDAQLDRLSRGRFGTFDALAGEDLRVREAVAALTRFRADQVVFQPNTSTGLLHAFFGLTGPVALSAAEFPSMTFAATRAEQTLGVVTPQWLEPDHGGVTPGSLRDQLDPAAVAVAVSLVDYRTGYLADLEGIRQVIGDRLLIVDAIQGFGVVDAPFELADVVVSGGQKWVRAGWGTGFLALSDRAVEHLTPVWSGWTGVDAAESTLDDEHHDGVPDPASAAHAFSITSPDPVAQARLSAALEHIAAAGVPEINARIALTVSQIIDLADEYALPVVSPRAESERAGIVVVEPAPDQLTALAAALHNHGVTVTGRGGRVRISPHASTTAESLEMLRAAFLSFATTASI